MGIGTSRGLLSPLDKRRWLLDVLAKNVASHEVWEPRLGLVRQEFLSRDGEHLCYVH